VRISSGERSGRELSIIESPAIDDAYFPDHVVKVPGQYTIKARSAAEIAALRNYGARC